MNCVYTKMTPYTGKTQDQPFPAARNQVASKYRKTDRERINIQEE